MTPPHEEHASLSWRLIEWKVAYYLPEYVHGSRRLEYTVDDDTYDAAEQRYLALCRELGLPNTVVHKAYPGFEEVGCEHAMGEVDQSRPSVQLVLRKLSSPKGKPPRGKRTGPRRKLRTGPQGDMPELPHEG